MSQTWPTLYTKTAAGKINFWQIWTDGGTVRTRWGVLDGKELSDYYEATPKNVGRSNETTAAEQADLEAQSKYEEKIRLKYVGSPAEAQAQLNIKPMLAYTLDEKRAKKLRWPADIQPKLNGVRCFAYNMPDGGVRLMSRGGKDYTLPHIQDNLRGRIPDGHVLDGELYVHRVPLQTIRSWIETPQANSLQVRLHVYDYTTVNRDDHLTKMSWRERRTIQGAWLAMHAHELTASVCPVLTLAVHSMEDVGSLHDAWVEAGYEGAIVRAHEGQYRLGARSPSLLKVKRFQDQEFVVVGWKVGKDGVPIFRCVQEEEREFDVRPMGTEAERYQMLFDADNYIGQLLTVRYQERSVDNIPIFPVGVSFRSGGD